MILQVQDIRASEKLTIEKEGISSVDLMERAATSFVEHLYKTTEVASFREVVVFCGPGNNGGDGLVISRLLALNGCTVHTILCYEKEHFSEEFTINLGRLKELQLPDLNICHYTIESELPEFTPGALVIDAIFGIGLSKAATGYFAEIIQYINSLQMKCIAVDVPSGLFTDRHTPEQNPCIKADITFTFQFQKPAYLLPENEKKSGQVSIIDIGLLPPAESELQYETIDLELIKSILVKPSRFAHKGSNGHGLLIAGSVDMPGAAFLSAKSALRGGIGKVTVHLPSAMAGQLPLAVPEAIISRDENASCFSKLDLEKHPTINAIAIGPGIGQNRPTIAALSNLLEEVHSPIIFDADALNILADNKTWLAYLPEGSILTPHFKEFERLTGKAENDFERLEKLKQFAQRYSVVVILKGANSVVAMPNGKLFFNTTGNPGMATAGSGDVLTGLLLALLAKGYPSPLTAMIGVYIHGLAGDLAVEEFQSYESLIASDICNYFGSAFEKIRNY